MFSFLCGVKPSPRIIGGLCQKEKKNVCLITI